jgi:hypothetical protein
MSMRGDFGVQEFLRDIVVRPLMLVVWLAVFWGTLMLGAWFWSLITVGPGETWSRIRPGDEAGAAAVVNLVLPLLALVVWLFVGYVRWRVLVAKRELALEADDSAA